MGILHILQYAALMLGLSVLAIIIVFGGSALCMALFGQDTGWIGRTIRYLREPYDARSPSRRLPIYSSVLSRAGDPNTPRSEIYRLLKFRHIDREVFAALYTNPAVSPRTRRRVLRRYERVVPLNEILDTAAVRQIDADILAPLLKSEDPVVLHAVLQKINRFVDEHVRADAYSRLAYAAGPETVWVLELERVGTVTAMSASVRESMTAGSAEPLLREWFERRRRVD
jgi:hypothetical protein